MKRIVASAFGLAIALPALPASATPAPARLTCYPLTQIESALDAEYGELRRFSGREATGIEYRLYINAKTGSWSWIGIPAGAAVGCLIFAGRSDEAPPAAAPPPAGPQAHF
jgi:hypothetical protein